MNPAPPGKPWRRRFHCQIKRVVKSFVPRVHLRDADLTGSVQAPRGFAEATRLGVEPGRDQNRRSSSLACGAALAVARTAEFSKTVRSSGVGLPPAPKRDGPV